jgi:serine/threonine protein kinase
MFSGSMMIKKPKKCARIESFDLNAGRIIASKYEIIEKIGSGWQGEVFLIREIHTGIDRAAKFFYPHRNERDKVSYADAKKLHNLRNCPFLIQYHTHEKIRYKGQAITALISDYVDGELLSDFIKRQPGKRLHVFEALHLLYELVKGVEPIHLMNEYHGDLHTENVIVKRLGVRFELKLFDPYHWSGSRKSNIQQDVYDVIHIFYESIGGSSHYAKQPPIVKAICCGLKKTHIAKKFKTATDLRFFLETVEWE